MTISIKSLFLSFLLTIFCVTSLFPQNISLQNTVQNKYTFSQFGHETWDFINQPTKWEGSDWLKIGLISAGTFLIIKTADQPIRTAVLKDQRYYKSVLIVSGRMWGEVYTPLVLFGGFAIYSLATNDIKTRKIAYEIGQASLYAAAASFLRHFHQLLIKIINQCQVVILLLHLCFQPYFQEMLNRLF